MVPVEGNPRAAPAPISIKGIVVLVVPVNAVNCHVDDVLKFVDHSTFDGEYATTENKLLTPVEGLVA
jgi:hypothetical protein